VEDKMASIELEHIGIPAPGAAFDPTVQFYAKIFGMQIIREVNANQHLAFLSDGKGGRIEVLDTEGEPMANPAHLAFMVPFPEFEETRTRLAEQGVAFDPVFVTDTGDHLAYFNDPAGNRAQLVGRVTPLE
jgi:catechol 2,3-dioxygenase-like lactoylglutathione lyase family enzyme